MRKNYHYFNERAIELFHKWLAGQSHGSTLTAEHDQLSKIASLFPFWKEVKEFLDDEYGLRFKKDRSVTRTSVHYKPELEATKAFMVGRSRLTQANPR